MNSQIPKESVRPLTDLIGIQTLYSSWQEQFQATEQKLGAIEKLDGIRRQLQEEQTVLMNKRSELNERQAALKERRQFHQQQQEDLATQVKEDQQAVLQLREVWQQQVQAIGWEEEAVIEPESLLASLQEKWQAFQKQQQAEDREGPELSQRQQRLERDQATLRQQEQ